MSHKITLDLTAEQAAGLLADVDESIQSGSEPAVARTLSHADMVGGGRAFPVKTFEGDVGGVNQAGTSVQLDGPGDFARGGFTFTPGRHGPLRVTLARSPGVYAGDEVVNDMGNRGTGAVQWKASDFDDGPLYLNFQTARPETATIWLIEWAD